MSHCHLDVQALRVIINLHNSSMLDTTARKIFQLFIDVTDVILFGPITFFPDQVTIQHKSWFLETQSTLHNPLQEVFESPFVYIQSERNNCIFADKTGRIGVFQRTGSQVKAITCAISDAIDIATTVRQFQFPIRFLFLFEFQLLFQNGECLNNLHAGADGIGGGNGWDNISCNALGTVQRLERLDSKHRRPQIGSGRDKPHGQLVVLVELFQQLILGCFDCLLQAMRKNSNGFFIGPNVVCRSWGYQCRSLF
mmetsp:Transcript_3947/g.6211  ORF Transcript_3947/g.6211 Transcript_3947/m.6211 type:complete len:253 (+) Transcript_3947:366-1124(+)